MRALDWTKMVHIFYGDRIIYIFVSLIDLIVYVFVDGRAHEGLEDT